MANKIEIIRRLEEFVTSHPEYANEVKDFAGAIMQGQGSSLDNDAVYRFLVGHEKMYNVFCAYLVKADCRVVYNVYDKYAPEIEQRLEQAEVDYHFRNWASAVKSLPKYTLPLPEVNAGFLKNAREVWRQNIYGNEEVLNTIIRHGVEYARTGKTVPILLVGPPGIGKTAIAKNYGKILGLPHSFISGPSASVNRGLAGAPNLYVGAGAGAIVQSMVSSRVGNPVICIDEVEKAVGGYSGNPRFQDELLAALDESNVSWHDNFLEMDIDASHVPYIFTANEKEPLSPPFLDRVELVEMQPPTKEMMYNITKDYTLPKVLKNYACDLIRVDDKKIEILVDTLWENANSSCRFYKKAVDLLVSTAYLEAIEHECTICISEKDVYRAADLCTGNLKNGGKIGFRAGSEK